MGRFTLVVFAICVLVHFGHGTAITRDAVKVGDAQETIKVGNAHQTVKVGDELETIKVDAGQSIVKADDGEYEIVAGDCDAALARDMIYREHLSKVALPFVSRDAKSSWSGNARIYCLKVFNDKDESGGSTCKITEGGIGFDHVAIEMHSKANHGLEFEIEIYAR